MSNKHIIGIDIGTDSIKLVIAEELATNQPSRILHTIESPSHGFRHGYITDPESAAKSLARAIKKSEKEYQQKITQARFSIGGIGLCSQYVRTSIDISKRNNEISDRNVEEVVQRSEELFINKYPNKKILHIIPVKYRVDGRDVLGTPIGMYGEILEVKVIFITILEHHYDSFVSIIETNNITIQDIIASPLAGGFGSLDYKKKTQGCMLTNIGSETTSIATFENGIITSLDILNIGSNDITNDIALGLQIPLDTADKVKMLTNTEYPKKQVEEIIQARTTDILELMKRHLEKIKKNRLLPGGVVFIGGGSNIHQLNEYTKQELNLPSEITFLNQRIKKAKRTERVENKFAVAYGLCISESGHQNFSLGIFSFKKIKHSLQYWFNQIMP